jgi:hypothetical protein
MRRTFLEKRLGAVIMDLWSALFAVQQNGRQCVIRNQLMKFASDATTREKKKKLIRWVELNCF